MILITILMSDHFSRTGTLNNRRIVGQNFLSFAKQSLKNSEILTENQKNVEKKIFDILKRFNF